MIDMREVILNWITHAEPHHILKAFSDVTCAVDGERIFFQQVIQAFQEPELILNKNMAIDDDHVVIKAECPGVLFLFFLRLSFAGPFPAGQD